MNVTIESYGESFFQIKKKILGRFLKDLVGEGQI
jgi:hypothetical protein